MIGFFLRAEETLQGGFVFFNQGRGGTSSQIKKTETRLFDALLAV